MDALPKKLTTVQRVIIHDTMGIMHSAIRIKEGTLIFGSRLSDWLSQKGFKHVDIQMNILDKTLTIRVNKDVKIFPLPLMPIIQTRLLKTQRHPFIHGLVPDGVYMPKIHEDTNSIVIENIQFVKWANRQNIGIQAEFNLGEGCINLYGQWRRIYDAPLELPPATTIQMEKPCNISEEAWKIEKEKMLKDANDVSQDTYGETETTLSAPPKAFPHFVRGRNAKK